MASKKATEAQAKNQARQASLADLLEKKPLRKTITIYSGDDPLEVTVQSIGRKNYAALLEDCTHTEERAVLDDEGNETDQTEEVEVVDEEAFVPRLISASLTAAGLEASVEDVMAMYDAWNTTEFDALAFAAYEVNVTDRVKQAGNA